MKRILLLILLVFSFSQAQECKSLLEDFYPDTQQDFKTVEFSMNSETSMNGMEIVTEATTIIDRENHRLYSKTLTQGMTMIMIIQDGDFSMSMQMPDGSMQALPAMPGMAAQLEPLFDTVFEQGGLPQDYEIVSCDGQVSVKDLISGEQITILSKIPKVDPTADENAELQWEEQEVTMIIDNNSGLMGMFMNQEGLGKMFILVELQNGADNYIHNMESTMYKVVDGNYELFSRTTLTYNNINQPIDESLFNSTTE